MKKNDFGTLRRHWPAWPLEIIMLVTFVMTLQHGQTKFALESGFTFLISFTPLVVERIIKLRIPLLYQFLFVAFVFGSMFTGEVLGLYGKIWPWDDWVHLVAGLLLGLLMFIMLRVKHYRDGLKLGLGWTVGMMIGFSSVVSMLWELLEFGSDELFGTFSQGNDLFDTMIDMRNGLIGGSVVALLAIFYCNHFPSLGFKWMVTLFDRVNPGLRSKVKKN